MSLFFRTGLSARHASTLAFVVAIAIVLVQGLGALHRIAHGAPSRIAQGTAAGIEARDPASGGTAWLERLFAGHTANGDACDAFDQASHGDLAVGVAALHAPVDPPAVAPCARHAAWHIAAQARGFLARGPPPALA